MGLRQVNDLATEVRVGFGALLSTLVAMGDLLATQDPNSAATEDWNEHVLGLVEQGFVEDR